ncbi:hypothetical protein AAFN85_14700 [Mucilaginibacter sp. CAU 1740]|uniref:hypothetical protein n=1 Tax=Mucilaginibacter sp. CAU 1740 TaxID=3140365 RepID=UPI00325A7C07
MKTLKITIILLLLFQCCFGQLVNLNIGSATNKYEQLYKGSLLDSTRVNLERGDKQSLFRIAQYLDSSRLMTENLGYHILHTSQNEIARRLIRENCSFLNSEFVVNDSTKANDFLGFLMTNINNISFSYEAYAYLITPLDKRDVKYEIRELTPNRWDELKKSATEILNNRIVKHNNIEQLIKDKNPEVLFNIASLLYSNRTHFNQYQSNTLNYINLIELLTGTDIGVEDEHNKISYHIDKDFEPASRLNLLIFFAKNYKRYKWNERAGIFSNDLERAKKPYGEALFQLLNSKTDSVAQNAFVKLTIGNKQIVQALADEYNNANIDFNRKLPIFAYRFLKQLVALTTYCREHHIDFYGSDALRRNINRLQQELPFKTRHLLEDNLIQQLTLSDITALEYWSLVNQTNYELDYSVGRILDVFYSQNWDKLVHNKTQLDLYLKKSVLFNNIQIIGICNNYLKKFIGNGDAVVAVLKNNPSANDDITRQTALAIDFAGQKPLTSLTNKKTNDANFDAEVKDLRAEFLKIKAEIKDDEKRDHAVLNLYAKISYAQIGLALELIEDYKFKPYMSKYSFADRDFGFFMVDFDKPASRADFIKVYKSHTQAALYAYYLNKAGIIYTHADGSLNYDKIYEILKYDVTNAFSGAGGGTRDNEVYSVIKLLELKFKTTLGFPQKLCNSAGTYGCDSKERAVDWMNYMKAKGLLVQQHNQPISFSYPLIIDEKYRF